MIDIDRHIKEITDCAECIQCGGRYIDDEALMEAVAAIEALRRERDDLASLLKGIAKNIDKALMPVGS